jgi:predicted TIM-barrel fold metal-dependent hydrolase
VLDLLRAPNWWVKVSGAERISAAGPPFRDAVPFARRLIEAAPDRTLWGTDWPHPNVRWEPDEADLVDLLPEFADADALRRVLVDNPARLYGFA